MKNLSFQDLRSCSLVCKEWRIIVLAQKTFWTGGVQHNIAIWRRRCGMREDCHPDWNLPRMPIHEARRFALRCVWGDHYYYDHPLLFAIQLGDLHQFSILYEHVRDKNPKTLTGQSLLHVLAENFYPSALVDFVMAKMTDADYEHQDDDDMTPLHVAVIARNVLAVEKYVGVMKNFYHTDRNNLTPLDYALERQREHLLVHMDATRWGYHYPPETIVCCEHEDD